VSGLTKNRPTGFSTGRLLALLNALDLDIVLRPGGEPRACRVKTVFTLASVRRSA